MSLMRSRPMHAARLREKFRLEREQLPESRTVALEEQIRKLKTKLANERKLRRHAEDAMWNAKQELWEIKNRP